MCLPPLVLLSCYSLLKVNHPDPPVTTIDNFFINKSEVKDASTPFGCVVLLSRS
jgi:hypothetical protein